MNEQGHKKIDSANAFFLITIATMIDVIQFLFGILLIGIIINPFIHIAAIALFAVWLSHLNISMMSSRLVFKTFSTAIVEFIPFINFLPVWTFFIVFVIMTEKAPREGYNEAI